MRYADVVWEAASHVVAQMGAFRFSSLHVRRNELQYKNEFTSANQTLGNIEPLLRRGDCIATRDQAVRCSLRTSRRDGQASRYTSPPTRRGRRSSIASERRTRASTAGSDASGVAATR